MTDTATPVPPTDPTLPDPAEAPSRPEWLPEKFETPEAFAEAYSQLESKLGTPSDAPDPADAVNPPEEEAPAQITVDTVLEQAGLDRDAMVQEYQENGGSLTDATLAKLEAAGYNRDFVGSYLEGEKAKAQREFTEVFKDTPTGGEDWADKVAPWLSQNLNDQERTAFNDLMNSDSTEAKRIAIRDAYAKYSQANGSEGNLISGTPAGGGGKNSYSHHDEFRQDVASEQYAKSAAFRNQVARKRANSNF